jgi:hypothetical protein
MTKTRKMKMKRAMMMVMADDNDGVIHRFVDY